MPLTGFSARDPDDRHPAPTLTPADGNEGRRPVAARARSGVAALVTVGRYGIVWPIFMARETLAAYDDVLALCMNFVLGDDWDDGGLDQARRSRRRRVG